MEKKMNNIKYNTTSIDLFTFMEKREEVRNEMIKREKIIKSFFFILLEKVLLELSTSS
tara:strand:+ start:220 stop:393 length:174 start_codon:yes stop_codon:yes gene_type:complete